MHTDTTEKCLESLIVEAMTGVPGGVDSTEGGAYKPPTPYGGTGWLLGRAEHYNREHAVDLYELLSFLQTHKNRYSRRWGFAPTGRRV